MITYRSAIKAVEVKKQFTCTDGSEFGVSGDAELHQADLCFVKWYEEGAESGRDPALECGGVAIDAEAMVRWLRNHQYEVNQFFGGADLSTPYKERDTE